MHTLAEIAKLLYQFSRDLVEVGDTKDFLKRFG